MARKIVTRTLAFKINFPSKMQSLTRKENLKHTFIKKETKMARKLVLLDKLIQYFIGKPFVERQLMSQQGKKVKVFFCIIFLLHDRKNKS